MNFLNFVRLAGVVVIFDFLPVEIPRDHFVNGPSQ